MARKPRNLSAEEKALWKTVTRNTTPLHPGRKPELLSKRDNDVAPPPEREPIPPFEVGVRASTAIPTNNFTPDVAGRLKNAPLRMDRKAHRRLKSGKSEPEARIDLHGMTAERAHGALTSFILAARARGLRTVLVITGKGRPDRGDDLIPRPHGVLRNEVPRWLSIPPLASAVLQIVPAHQRHGGSGAYYVHLSRAR